MGRFASAKANSDNPSVIRKALNYLTELLDREYKITATIAGKKVEITINTTIGIEISVDSIKVFGIDNTGKMYVQSIANPAATAQHIEIGADGSIQFFGLSGKFLTIQETEFNGFRFLDLNNDLIFTYSRDMSDTIGLYKDSLTPIVQYTSSSVEMYFGSDSLGVDGTGAFKFVGGVKTYL